MTEEELKTKCKGIMETHLKSKGYPNLSDQQIMNELPEMWKLFENEGLMEELKNKGYSYQRFVQTAQSKAMQVRMEEELGSLFGVKLRR